MKCKCGSYKFYIKGVEVTFDYDFSKLSREKVEENLEKGGYINFNWLKGNSQVICAYCGNIIID